jgi:hypothetical protein
MTRFLKQLLFISSFFMGICILLHTASCSTGAAIRSDCIDTLQKAIVSAPSFFVKVHAGEALVANGYTDQIESTFISLRDANPDNATGAIRVLARFYNAAGNQQKYQECINAIINRYQHGDSAHPRLVAVESLGKLGYQTPLPEILQDAQQGTGGFKAMARWVLSNNGEPDMEDSLAALLSSQEVADYRSAAYALRFHKSVSGKTYNLLEQCAARLNPADAPSVYVWSALFVHAPSTKKEAVKKQLIQLVQGAPAAKYEIGEALSLNGDTADLSLLETLLHDADNDVRVSAANAILTIHHKQ